MKTLLLIVVVALLLGSDAVYACSCGKIGSPMEELKKHRAVFIGEVISIRQPMMKKLRNSKGRFYERGPVVEVKFRVEKAWKGVEGETFVVQTNFPDGASCGWDFKERQSYLVYAYGSQLTVSYCSRTTPLNSAQEDIKVLDQVAVQTRKR